MNTPTSYDVIIIGGSYAGLSAAMSLGRALRSVLVIDSGKPCNRQTPHSHNLLTWDGTPPQEIAALAREQVQQYHTVHFRNDLATKATPLKNDGFEIGTSSGETFIGKRIVLANGLKDIMPETPGFAECWGISILHCPYCHGYEFRGEKTGIFANEAKAFEMIKLISQWSRDLVVFTHGKSGIDAEHLPVIRKRNIEIIETPVKSIIHINGELQQVELEDGRKIDLKAMYARPDFEQHSGMVQELGCLLNDHGLIETDNFRRTTIPGVFACGDNSTFGRSLAMAIAAGNTAGAFINKEMIEESWLLG